jgi:uncharacterized protein involved in outer membrane biogenesis
LRAVLTLLAVLLIAVLTTALVGPYFIDWSQHRAEVERQLSIALGRPVAVRGSIKAALLPTPYLKLGDLAVGGADGGAKLSCKEVRLELALAPLAHGEIHFTDAVFERPQIELQRGGDGAIQPPRLDLKVAPESVGLDTVALRDATIVVAGAGDSPSITINGLYLDAQADSLRGPFKGKGRAVGPSGAAVAFRFVTGVAKRGALPIKFTADLGASTPHAEFDGALNLGAAAFGYSGAALFSGVLVGADGAASTPWRVSGDLAANLDVAKLQKLEARLGEDERALTMEGSAEAHFGASPRLSVTLSAKELNVDALLREKGEEFAPPKRAYRTLVDILASAGIEHGPPLPVALKIDAPGIILGGDTLNDAALDASATPGAPITIGVQALAPGRSRLAASGDIEFGPAGHFTGALDARVGDVDRLRDWISEGDDDLHARLAAIGAVLPYRTASLAADVDLSETSLVARDLTLGLARSTLKGAIAWTRAIGADRDRLFVDLKTDSLDLDALPNLAAGGDYLHALDLSLALEASAIHIARFGEGPVDSGSLALKLAKNGDEVTLDHLAIADLGGATIDANGALKPNERWLSVDVDAQRLREFALLVRRVAPGGLGQALVDRAGALSPARLTVNARSSGVAKDNVFAPDSLSIRGLVGATRVTAKLDRAADAGGKLVASVSFEAPEVSPLLRQFGLQASPVAGLGRGSISLRAQGDWSSGFDGEATASLAGADVAWHGHGLGGGDIAGGAMTLKAANTTPLLAVFGIVAPDASSGPSADLSGDMNWSSGEVRLSHLKGAANGANLSGDLVYRPAAPQPDAAPAGAPASDPPPTVEGALTLDHLSLGALASLVLGPAQPAKPGQIWSDLKFSTVAASPPSANVALTIATFDIMSDLPAHETNVRLKISPGAVALEDVKMRVGGGAAGGHATLRRDGANAALSGQISLDSIAVDRGGLTAKIAGALDFAATGQSVGALIGGLAGSGQILLTGGELPRLDPDALRRVVEKAQGAGFDVDDAEINRLLGAEMDRRSMRLVDGAAPAAISAGVLRVGPFDALHPGGDAKVQASVDLRSLGLDLRATIDEAAPPRFFWSGAPPAIAVALKGRVGALSREIDSASLANGLEAQAIARETERIAQFESDIRERAALNRVLKASRAMRQRELELQAYAVDQARLKSEADRRRVEDEALKANEEARKADEARRVEEARKAEETRKTEEARKAEEEARKLLAPAPPAAVAAPAPQQAPPPPNLAAPINIAPTALQPPPRPTHPLDPAANGIY